MSLSGYKAQMAAQAYTRVAVKRGVPVPRKVWMIAYRAAPSTDELVAAQETAADIWDDGYAAGCVDSYHDHFYDDTPNPYRRTT